MAAAAPPASTLSSRKLSGSPTTELRNLADDPAQAPVRGELLGRLRRHLAETRDPILTEGVVSPMQRKAWSLLKNSG
jgi:hypothetical protein